MPHRPTSRLNSALRGVAALITLLVLLVAVPALLWRFGVLPHTVPTWHDVTTALTSPDDGTLFLGALTLLGFGGWLSFVCSVALEAGALLQHRTAPKVKVLGATQRLAGSLVATVVLLLPASGALAYASPANAVTATAPATVKTTTRPVVTTTVTTTSIRAQQSWTGPLHTVVRGDTLWDLADHYLGSGTRWHEIASLNAGLRMGDGTVLTADLTDLQPDWVLRLPSEAAPQSGHAGAKTAQHIVTVTPGETLSEIAQDELGHADAYPLLLEATTGVQQPVGGAITNPDLIIPGQHIVIPGVEAVAPPAVVPPVTPPAAAPTTPDQVPTPPVIAPTPPPAPSTPPLATPNSTSQPAETIPSPTAPSDNSAPLTSTDTTAPAAATSGSEQAQAPISIPQTVGGIAALLGAGTLAVIAWRRRSQQRDRRPNERIALPEETSDAEQLLERTSSPASAELLDRALRTLAAQHPDALPQVRAARVQADQVEILVDDTSSEALAPFTDRPRGWWGVRAGRTTLLSQDEAREVPAPYPGLATIGTDADGAVLMANLPLQRVLLLDGDEQHVREVARGIAMEVGTALWADHIEVLTAGFGLELQHHLPQCRTTFVPTLAAATADLARVLVEAHQAEHEGGPAPQPWMVVCANIPTSEDLYAFADLMGKVGRRQQIAAVLPAAGGAQDLFPEADVLNASLVTDAQPVEALDGAEVVLQRVTDEAYRQLTTTMATAAQPAVPAERPWDRAPDPDHPTYGPIAINPTASNGPRGHLSLLTAPNDFEQTAEAVQAATIEQADGEPAPEPMQQAAASGASPAAPLPIATEQRKAQARVSVVQEGEVRSAPEGAAPQVQVLGPLRITGIGETPLQPRLVLLAALLIFKSDRDYGAIAHHMDPANPWTLATLNTHMSRLRGRLGADSDQQPYLRTKPKGVQQYSLSGSVTVDYADFKHLAERGLPHGTAGVLDLEAALALVRGRPFGGAGAHSWAAPLVQTMVSEIVTVANTIAHLRIQDEALNIDAARHAITVGLGVEPAAEMLYRAWMRIEHRAGNPAGVREVIDQVHQMIRAMEFDGLQDETEQLIQRITRGRATVRGI